MDCFFNLKTSCPGEDEKNTVRVSVEASNIAASLPEHAETVVLCVLPEFDQPVGSAPQAVLDKGSVACPKEISLRLKRKITIKKPFILLVF